MEGEGADGDDRAPGLVHGHVDDGAGRVALGDLGDAHGRQHASPAVQRASTRVQRAGTKARLTPPRKVENVRCLIRPARHHGAALIIMTLIITTMEEIPSCHAFGPEGRKHCTPCCRKERARFLCIRYPRRLLLLSGSQVTISHQESKKDFTHQEAAGICASRGGG